MSAFTDLESIKREKGDLQFQARTGRLEQAEYDRRLQDLNHRQAALKYSAASELRGMKESLIKNRQAIENSLATAADRHAESIDLARLEKETQRAERLLSRAKTPEDVQAIVKGAEARGDKIAMQAAYETASAFLEDAAARTFTGPDMIRAINIKNAIRPALHKLLYSEEQTKLMELKEQNDQALVDFVQSVSSAEQNLSTPPKAEDFLAGRAEANPFEGLTDGIALTPNKDATVSVEVA